MPATALSRWTVGFLLAALALAGVLAHQALDAARSQRAAAVQTLRRYAGITAWELATDVRQELLANHYLLFSPVNRLVGGQVLGGGAPLPLPADSLAALLGAQHARCGCAPGVRFYFRYDLADSTLSVAGAPPRAAPVTAAVRRWVRDTVAGFTARMEIRVPPVIGRRGGGVTAAPEPAGGGKVALAPAPIVVRTRDGHPYVMPGLVTNFGQASLYGGPEDGLPGRLVLVYLLPRTTDGRPLAVYGFAADAEAFARPLLDRVLAKPRLLPPALAGGAPADSLVALAVRDGAGRLLYRSAGAFAGGALPRAYEAADTLEARFGGLQVEVALSPAVAERMLPGGVPRSRLPGLVGLFALTAGLAAVAVVQLRREQALARVRADFVSGVSHELRTPLAQIRLLAELLHQGKPATEAGRRRAARIIDQEARRLTYLVENILAFSRAERSAGAPAAAGATAAGAVDLAAEAAEVVETFAPLAAAAEARVTLDAPAAAPARVDPSAVRQVLLNYLDNAVRYGPRGQQVAVGVAPGAGRTWRVWVDDEGPGVPPGERVRVFTAYYRMARDAAVTGGGSGIGLAVVRDLAARQGGRAWVEDAPGGRGARFVVEFPAAPDDAAPDAASGVASGVASDPPAASGAAV